jgi:hypothetical protein
MFDELEKYMKVFDEWVPPEVKPYVPAVKAFCVSTSIRRFTVILILIPSINS